jgi:hypothetical protein
MIRLHTRGDRERGAALVVVLLVMFTLLSLGVLSIWLTGGNLQVSANMNLRTQTLYCAEAGVERARGFLNTAPPGAVAQFLSLRLAGSGNLKDDVPTALDANGKPNGVGAILVDGTGPLTTVAYPPASFGRPAGAATLMGYYTVWIRNDLAEIRELAFTTDSNSTIVIRSQCVAPDGRTNATVEVTFIPPLGAAWAPLAAECLDSGKNNDDANTNTVHCNRGR